MKQRILSMGLLLAVIALAGIALYWDGNYVVYMLAYIFSFVFLLCGTVLAASATREKIVQVIVYALILAAQILFAALMMRPAGDDGQQFALYRLLGVLLVLVPFFVRQGCFFQRTKNSR